MTRNPLARWSEASQQQARRNAMVASTALAARRSERDEVDAFLAAHTNSPSRALPRPRRALSRPVAHSLPEARLG